MRGKHSTAKRRYSRGFTQAGGLVDSRIQKAGASRGFANVRLLTHWEEIVGVEIARIAKPQKVSYARKGFGAKLTLLAKPAHAPELQMQLPRIKERVNASYGYRAEDAQGRDRADFVSVGVTVDLPLRTGSRQDRDVKAAVASTDALGQQRLLVLRALQSRWTKTSENLASLDDRIVRYRQKILPQMAEEVEATLTAYTNDDGDFADVMRARIAELNAAIELLKLQVSRLKNIAELNYTLLAAAGKGEQS